MKQQYMAGTRRSLIEMVRAAPILKAGLVVALHVLVSTTSVAAPDPCRIAVLGDSLAAGLGVSLDDAFPARLERHLAANGYVCTVINAGVSGDTSAGGLARLDWLLADAPSHVIVELGGNDGLRGLPTTAMEANLDAILVRLADEGVPTLLMGMLAPPNLGVEYGAEFAAVFQGLAARHDVAFYPFFLDGVATIPELNQNDGIHPNADGVAVIVERTAPIVEAWLNSSG